MRLLELYQNLNLIFDDCQGLSQTSLFTGLAFFNIIVHKFSQIRTLCCRYQEYSYKSSDEEIHETVAALEASLEVFQFISMKG